MNGRTPPRPLARQLGGGGRGPINLKLLLGLVMLSAAVLIALSATLKLPRSTLLLEEELANLLAAHRGGDCPCREGPGGAPVFCRLGLPPNATSAPLEGGSSSGNSSSSSSGGGGSGSDPSAHGTDGSEGAGEAAGGGQGAAAAASNSSSSSSSGGGSSAGAEARHRLAVLIPYRDRLHHLAALLAELRPHLQRQRRAHDVFVVEQADGFLFNRGLLLNAAAQLLQGSAYDYFVFQDVDTIPLEGGDIQYSFPRGAAPLHLTPHWLHPKSTFEDFFGGLLVISAQQFRHVNGFGTQFWGWGREDDNLRERLKRADMWPPEYPVAAADAGRLSKRRYFRHQAHEQAAELRAAADAKGEVLYFQENPRVPYRGAKIMSSQPQFLQDFATGLNTTMFSVLSISPLLNATRLSLSLHCDAAATPWCRPAAIGSRQAPPIKRAATVHAVVGS